MTEREQEFRGLALGTDRHAGSSHRAACANPVTPRAAGTSTQMLLLLIIRSALPGTRPHRRSAPPTPARPSR